jgi:hypothetical protein
VALEVHAAQPADVTEQRQVEADHVREVLRVGAEGVERVAGEAAWAGARSSQLARLRLR